MSFIFERRLGVGLTDRVAETLKLLLVMSNTTADTETEKQFVDDFTLLDEYDGATYARQTIAGDSAAVDLTNNRFEYTCSPVVFATLGVGTRQCVGALMLKFVTDDLDSLPDVFFDFSPFDGNGEGATFTPDAQGVLQAQNG